MKNNKKKPTKLTASWFMTLTLPVLIAVIFVGRAQSESINENPTLQNNLQVSSQRVFTEQKKNKLERFINQQIELYNIPGVAVGIVEPGQDAYFKGFGISNENGAPVSEKTSFRIASVTKTFTAVTIMQLVEEQKISIDAPVTTYIPWFKTKNKSNSDRVLVKHLLNHKSGFTRKIGNLYLDNKDTSTEGVKNAIAKLRHFELTRLPGTQYEYSNTNYQILGYILEQVEQASYESIIEDRIFNKLGMDNSFIANKPRNVSDLSQGFIYWFGLPQVTNIIDGRLDIAAGSIYSSVEDLNLYIADILSENGKLLTAQTKKRMFAKEEMDGEFYYSLGWMIFQQDDFKVIFHTGSYYGFSAVSSFLPEHKIGISVLVNINTAFGHANIHRFIRGIQGIVVNRSENSAEPDFYEKGVLWFVYLLPFTIILFGLIEIKKYKTGKKLALAHPLILKEVVLRVIFPSIFPLGICYLLLMLVPSLYAINLKTLALSEPSTFAAILFCSIVCLLWFFSRTWLLFRTQLKT